MSETNYNHVIDELLAMVKRDASKTELCDSVAKLGGIIRESLYQVTIFPLNMVESIGLQRLEAEIFNADHVGNNPIYGLTGAATFLYRKLSSWLQSNHMAWIQDLRIISPSVIEVKLHHMMYRPLVLDGSESDEQEMVRQQESILRNLGLEYVTEPQLQTLQLLATEENILKIEQILKKIGAERIKFSTDRMLNSDIRVLRSSEFIIDVSDVFTLDEMPVQADASTISETLSEPQKRRMIGILEKMQRNISELADEHLQKANAIQSNLLLYRYADLCDMLGLNTDIATMVHDFDENVSVQYEQEAKEIGCQYAKQMTTDMIAQGFEEYSDALRKNVRDNLFLTVEKCSVVPDNLIA